MTVKINREETNLEILALIAKAAARKYDCSVTIDFQNGQRRIEFTGNHRCKAQIASTVENYFKKPRERLRAETRPAAGRPQD